MSYHDRHLVRVARAMTKRSSNRHVQAVLRGINQITIKASTPEIHFGNLQSDLVKIGQDMRCVIKQMETCE